MTYTELLKKVLSAQRRIAAKGLSSYILCGHLSSSNELYIYIKYKDRTNHRLDIHDSIEHIINACIDFEKDSYIEIQKLCIDSMSDDVYIIIDGEYVKCKIEYISKDGICIDGKLYDKNEVFIKE